MMSFLRKSVKFGSIKPEAHKHISLRSRIMPTPLPERLFLSLQQHQGHPSIPRVKVGDHVLKYQLIATAADAKSIPLHAPTSGIVESIDTETLDTATQSIQKNIVIVCDDQEQSFELAPTWDYRTLSQDELLDKLASAGLCGMGGAGFPTPLKVLSARARGVSTLIINAAECEPYISCDEALIRERAELAMKGAEVLQASCQSSRCVIAIESNKQEAIAALKKVLGTSSIELKLIAPRYPAGDESQLAYAITGKEAPESGLPLDVGTVVFNAGTAVAAYEAVVLGKPCISRITTLTGTALQTPKNFDVPIGTPVNHLLNLCGVDSNIHSQTVHGGSLMGKQIDADAIAIKKTSHCIIAASDADFRSPAKEIACIRCGFCADACPSHLLPQQLLHFSKTEDFESLMEHGLTDCIECGACAFVCPSKIPLVQYYKDSKAAIRHEQQELKLGQSWQRRFQYVQYRRKKSASDKTEKSISTSKPAANKKSAFSRDQAKEEIAAAVARVKRKKAESQS